MPKKKKELNPVALEFAIKSLEDMIQYVSTVSNGWEAVGYCKSGLRRIIKALKGETI